jgi:hypothetical protein
MTQLLQANVSEHIIVVCENKLDLTDSRLVGEAEGGALADVAAASSCEASAKTRLGTEAQLQMGVRLIIDANHASSRQDSPTRSLSLWRERPATAVVAHGGAGSSGVSCELRNYMFLES